MTISKRLCSKMAACSGANGRVKCVILFVCAVSVLSTQLVWLQWSQEGIIRDRGDNQTQSIRNPCLEDPRPTHRSSELETRWRLILQEQNTNAQLADANVPGRPGQPCLQVVADQRPVLPDPTTTSASTTTCRLVSPAAPRVGDTLRFLVEARDAAGARRTIGGDFWFGVLKNKKLKAATAARVIDHDNGTYSMYFLASWSGQANLIITLVHPSQAITYLKSTFRHAEKKILWNGVFTKRESIERSPCWIGLAENRSALCAYRPERALRQTHLLCTPPKTLPCESLVGVTGATSYAFQFERVLPRDKAYLFERQLVKVNVTHGCSIDIKDSREGRSVLDLATLRLPTCRPDLPQTLSEGFWYKDQWTSLSCQPRVTFSAEIIRKCLANRRVYLTGDSTTRQWFAKIASTLGLGRKEDQQFKNKSFYLSRTDSQSNTQLEFIFHPLSLHPAAVLVNLSLVQFEADVLLNLPQDSCGTSVVVISPWAHFPNYPWSSYMEWLEGIRDAYLEVSQRCPGLIFIVKTPHPVNMQWEMKARDWMFYQMKEAMLLVFRGTGAIFVDIWDMNLAYPSAPINMHMPDKVIQEEVTLFLSHVCPR